MRIYFAGIGGVGLGPLAEIAHSAGFEVLGSDQSESLMTQELVEKGIDVSLSSDGYHIAEQHEKTPIDWVVYSAALPPSHPDLVFAKNHTIRLSKRDELLAYIIKEKDLKLLAIAGTHGKTTTTAMLVWLFRAAHIPISYSIGSQVTFGPSGHFEPKSTFFVYECDEFDRNFLAFSPYISTVTSLDYDHPDTYPTQESYLQAFEQFIAQSETTILYTKDSDLLTISPTQDILITLSDGDERLKSISLAGLHNRQNALLALEVFSKATETQELPFKAMSSFPGTSRRFEKLDENIYSDYAHHPVEIAATLQLARELNPHVITVYQPHQNTRQHTIKNEYSTCFNQSELVYWLPTYLSREDESLPILSPQDLSSQVKTPLIYSELNDELWRKLVQHVNEGKLVLFMGAGDVDTWARSQLQ